MALRKVIHIVSCTKTGDISGAFGQERNAKIRINYLTNMTEDKVSHWSIVPVTLY